MAGGQLVEPINYLPSPDHFGLTAFGKGFLQGFEDKGNDLWAGVQKTGKMYGDGARVQAGDGGFWIALGVGGNEGVNQYAAAKKEAAADFMDELNEIVNSAKQIAKLLWIVYKGFGERVDNFFVGNDEVARKLSAENQLVLQAVSYLLDKITYATDYDFGRIVGRVCAETLALAVEIAAGAYANRALSTFTLMDEMTKSAKLSGELRTLLQLARADIDAGLTTKMCFVAGTLVHTPFGTRPIEAIRSGDLVLSRDERTGQQAYKPVVDTVITRPSELHILRYGIDTDANGSLDSFDQLTTTAAHPFYVQGENAFVAAGDLKLGDDFLLASGIAAELVDIEVEQAADGDSFTTYNFEVSDFHTYFVGADGVWVHNSGDWFCDKVYNAFRNVRKRLRSGNLPAGVDPADLAKSEHFTAARWTAQNTANIPKENVAHLYTEALETIRREQAQGWIDYFEGRAMPLRPNNPNPLEAGHTLLKHVNVTDQDILDRSLATGKAASRFLDKETAEAAISLAIESDKDRIIKWAVKNNAGVQLELSIPDTGGAIGRIAESGAIRDAAGVRVILRADGIGGWLIQTAYPT
jgi:hypothetical protein